MSDFKEIAVRNRQNGVSGEQTGRDQYSTSLYPGESEYTHRQVIIDKMKAVGYPANEVDDAVADIWRG